MNDLQFYKEIVKAIEGNREFVLAQIIDTQGSTPGKVGFKMLVYRNGEVHGTVGGGEFEKKVINESLELLSSSEKAKTIDLNLEEIEMGCGGKIKVFLETHKARKKICIFGGGHVGKALAEISAMLNIPTVIIDDRVEFANKERFPVSEILLGDPKKYAKELDLKQDSVVIVTRSHEQDYKILKEILKKEPEDFPFYLGMIGSKTKVNKFFEELEHFIDKEKLKKIHAPIGLDIGAKTAREIAISILAELIREKNKREKP
jgi:xanthine dehydrogenase accessory factor